MKFFIYNPNPTYFTKIEHLFHRSFIDLGHSASTYEQAEYIFCIQHMNPYKDLKISGKKYILIQVEDRKTRPNYPDPTNNPNFLHIADRVWGFDIENPYEEYIYLGYHPFLDISSEPHSVSKEIGFLGSLKNRRAILHGKCHHKFSPVKEWNYLSAIRKLREYKINIHIHSYNTTRFTPWDRIIKMLSNGMFFMTEECFLPDKLSMVVQFKFDEYDQVISKYLANPKLRNEISRETFLSWKKHFDMREQLELKLRG